MFHSEIQKTSKPWDLSRSQRLLAIFGVESEPPSSENYDRSDFNEKVSR